MSRQELITESIDLLKSALQIYNTRPWQRKMITFKIEMAIGLLEDLPPENTNEIVHIYHSHVRLEELNFDCLLNILNSFTLQDLIKLRPICSLFRTIIDGQYLQKRDTIKIVSCLSDILQLSILFHVHQEDFEFLRISEAVHLDDIVFVERHVRSFVEFISLRMRNITKLVICTNNDRVLDSIENILHAMPQLKSLFLDQIETSSWKNQIFCEKVTSSILRLGQLEELFFFPYTRISMSKTMSDEQCLHFIDTMFDRLRIFYSGLFDYSIQPKSYENIRELSFGHLRKKLLFKATFPNLYKLSYDSCDDNFQSLSMESVINVRILRFDNNFSISNSSLIILNSLTKLEQLICAQFSWSSDIDRSRCNQTIHSIQLTDVEDLDHEYLIDLIQVLIKYFRSLQSITLHGSFASRKEAIQASVSRPNIVQFKQFFSTKYLGRFAPGFR